MNEYRFDFTPIDDSSEIVARVIDGKYKGNNIYLNKDSKTDLGDKVELLYEYLLEHKTLKITQKNLDILADSIVNDEEPENPMNH